MNKKCVHDGHRQRLTEQVANVGLANMSKIQQVEFLLFCVFPRGDTNPLAHQLLDKFGTFANILDASTQELMLVKGISQTSANKIKGIRNIINLYGQSKTSGQVSIKNDNLFLNYLESIFRFQDTELLYIFAITNNYKINAVRTYDLNQVRAVGIPVHELYGFIASTHPVSIAVAHNHPGGDANSSDDDKNAVDFIKNLIEPFGIKFVDSIVVGDDGIYSENQKGYLRSFDKIEYLDYLD